MASPSPRPASQGVCVVHAEGYAAFFTLPIHNFWLYLAARTVPYVVLSRLIQSSDTVSRFAEAGALYLAFVAAVWQLSGTGVLLEQAGLARAAIPALAGLGGVAMRDAYADTRGAAVLDAAIAGLLAVLSQVLLSGMGSELALPVGTVALGCLLSVPTLSLVRILLRPDDRTPRPG